MRAVVVFDTETTGLGPDARLVELAALRYEDGREVARLVTLVDPGMPIPAQATAIHGITDAMVAGAPTAGEALARFLDLAAGARLVAHNAEYDVRVLTYELSRARLPLLEHPTVCTCRVSRRYLTRLRNHKLDTVAESLQVERDGSAHRALSDALLAAGIYWRLSDLAREAREAQA